MEEVEDEYSSSKRKSLSNDFPILMEEADYRIFKEELSSVKVQPPSTDRQSATTGGQKELKKELLDVSDNEEMVHDIPSIVKSGKSKNNTLKDLLEIEEIVQEFTRKRYPIKEQREEIKVNLLKQPEPAAPVIKQDARASLRAANTSRANLPTRKLTEVDIPRLRAQWVASCDDIMHGVPEELPPVRGVNHHINLIDEGKRYNYHLPRCPDSLKVQLMEKIERYTRAGWWESVQTEQAAPMLCIPKKDGRLRTAIDCRKRNTNTVKDVTPFPDQDQIRLDVARAKVRSKIDFSDAYEQVRVHPADVPKTAFASIYGTYISHTMQIGDCNAPATFQRVMTMIFRDFIGIFLHVYLDDLFVYSNSIEEHENHLALMFQKIREHKFYLKEEKCELYAETVDCLGHVIDDKGLHAAADKMARIREWRRPRTYNDIQRFLGLVQYLAHFLPDISA